MRKSSAYALLRAQRGFSCSWHVLQRTRCEQAVCGMEKAASGALHLPHWPDAVGLSSARRARARATFSAFRGARGLAARDKIRASARAVARQRLRLQEPRTPR